MAAAASPSIRRKLADITECAICTEVYTDPRSLPCLHSYCLKCVEQWGRDKLPGDEMECPICRKQFVVPDGGLCDLPRNFFIENMKLIRDMSCRPVSDDARNYCEACSSDETDPAMRKLAAVYCVDCQEQLCQSCDDAHTPLKATRFHRRVRVGSQMTSGSILAEQLPVSMCDKHNDEKLKLFCTDCNAVVCMMCFVAAHRSHTCLDVNDVAVEFRSQVTADVASVAEGIDRCGDVLKRLADEKQEFIDRINQLEREVCEDAEHLTQIIERHKRTLLANLKTIKQERLKQVDHVSDDVEQHVSTMNSLKQYAEELCRTGTASDIGREANALRDRIKELLTFDCTHSVLNDLGSVDVRYLPSEITRGNDDAARNVLGRISVSSETPVHTEVAGGSPEVSTPAVISFESNLAPHSSQTTTVEAGISPTTTAVQSTTPSTLTHVICSAGSAIHGMTSLNDLLYVARQRDIAVYDTATFTLLRHIAVGGLTDDIRGLASCAVKTSIYVNDCSTVHRIKPSAKNRTMSWRIDGYGQGLSVNGLNNVLVVCRCNPCLSRPNKILEYTKRGTIVRAVSLQSDIEWPWHARQLSGGLFVVSHGMGSDSLHRVCLVDREGRVVVRYGNAPGSTAAGQLNEPTHFVVGRDGSLFVADNGNNRIVVLTSSLSWSRDLPVSVGGGLRGPSVLYLDEAHDRLYVGEENGGRVLVTDNVGIQ